jgi:hypothetical protein
MMFTRLRFGARGSGKMRENLFLIISRAVAANYHRVIKTAVQHTASRITNPIIQGLIYEWIFYEASRLGSPAAHKILAARRCYRPTYSILSEIAEYVSEAEFFEIIAQYEISREHLTKNELLVEHLTLTGFRSLTGHLAAGSARLVALAREFQFEALAVASRPEGWARRLFWDANLEILQALDREGLLPAQLGEVEWRDAVASKNRRVVELLDWAGARGPAGADISTIFSTALEVGNLGALEWVRAASSATGSATGFELAEIDQIHGSPAVRAWLLKHHPIEFRTWLTNPEHALAYGRSVVEHAAPLDLEGLALIWPHLSDSGRWYVIDHAVVRGRLEIVRWFVSGSEPKGPNLQSLLDRAIYWGQYEIVEYLFGLGRALDLNIELFVLEDAPVELCPVQRYNLVRTWCWIKNLRVGK